MQHQEFRIVGSGSRNIRTADLVGLAVPHEAYVCAVFVQISTGVIVLHVFAIFLVFQSTICLQVVKGRSSYIRRQFIREAGAVVIGDHESDIRVARTPFSFVMAVFLAERVRCALRELGIGHAVVGVNGVVIPFVPKRVAADIITAVVCSDAFDGCDRCTIRILGYFEVIYPGFVHIGVSGSKPSTAIGADSSAPCNRGGAHAGHFLPSDFRRYAIAFGDEERNGIYAVCAVGKGLGR